MRFVSKRIFTHEKPVFYTKMRKNTFVLANLYTTCFLAGLVGQKTANFMQKTAQNTFFSANLHKYCSLAAQFLGDSIEARQNPQKTLGLVDIPENVLL